VRHAERGSRGYEGEITHQGLICWRPSSSSNVLDAPPIPSSKSPQGRPTTLIPRLWLHFVDHSSPFRSCPPFNDCGAGVSMTDGVMVVAFSLEKHFDRSSRSRRGSRQCRVSGRAFRSKGMATFRAGYARLSCPSSWPCRRYRQPLPLQLANKGMTHGRPSRPAWR